MKRAIEQRTVTELRSDRPGELQGYAAVFDRPSRDLGGFTESIKRGAFARTLKSEESQNVMCLYEHDRKNTLGRVGAGTLSLAEDQRGLAFTIDLPDTTVGRDLNELVKRGDVCGCSFAFSIPDGGDTWSERGGKVHRELLDVNLFEITITSNPAYLDTTVAKRAFESLKPMSIMAMQIEILELESS